MFGSGQKRMVIYVHLTKRPRKKKQKNGFSMLSSHEIASSSLGMIFEALLSNIFRDTPGPKFQKIPEFNLLMISNGLQTK